jgi:hypothetical protein
VDHTAEYTLEVIPGMPEGHEVVFEGEADESPDWEAGDVIVRVRSKKDGGGWRRKETSLYWKETIGVDQVRSCSLSFPSRILTRMAMTRRYWVSKKILHF